MANERLTSLSMSITGMIVALSEDNPDATTVIMQLINRGELMLVLLLDSKYLYGSRIWELYSRICGEDFDHFIYHLTMELPDQETGQLSITGRMLPISAARKRALSGMRGSSASPEASGRWRHRRRSTTTRTPSCNRPRGAAPDSSVEQPRPRGGFSYTNYFATGYDPIAATCRMIL